MCLLIVAWQWDPHWPVVVGANRDEWLDRPSTAMTVLREGGPRIVGGRDDRAGGSWMAVNQFGVVCGLTNRPLPDGPDPTRRSRGRLPLVAARCRSAAEAADAMTAEADTNSYNPAWVLVADRRSLHYLEVGPDQATEPRQLGPGLHVLENAPLGAPSAKADHIRAALDGFRGRGVSIWAALPAVLSDHAVPDPPSDGHRFPDGRERLGATLAACVHADGYGSRSSTMVRLGVGATTHPEVLVTDGPPCSTPFADAGSLWEEGSGLTATTTP